MKAVVALGMLVLFLCGCGDITFSNATANAIQLAIDEGVAIPDGYILIEASAYGRFVNNNTLYLRNKENGRVYEYEGKKLGAEIVIPEGYSLVAVSAYGGYTNKRTFYCHKNGTDQVFVCSPH